MTKVLIVEGNTGEIIKRNQNAGLKLAWERYRDAISLHAPNIEFSVAMPLAARFDVRYARSGGD